jgi:hypothetical protein
MFGIFYLHNLYKSLIFTKNLVIMSTSQRVQAISDLVQVLTDAEQTALLKELKKAVLLAKAERLNRSVLSNTIDMSLIIKEVHKVRKAA